MPDPKYHGTDIRSSRRISRKHGRDVERARQRIEKVMDQVTSSRRRAIKKALDEEESLNRVKEMISSSFEAQLERENKSLSDWAKTQLRERLEELAKKVGIDDLEAISRASRKYEQFGRLVMDLEEEG